MVRKTFLAALILSALWFCGMTGVCFADVPEQLEQAAAHAKDGEYLEAEEIYKTIVTDYPQTAYALQAQKELVILYSAIEMNLSARAALDKLTTDFEEYSEPNDVAQALFDIARQYEWSTKYKEANKVFQQILDEQPQSWYVNRANLAVVRTNIMHLISLGKNTEAKKAFDKLQNDFSGHDDLPQAIYDIAKRYEWSHKYERANEIYLQLVQQYPESPWAGKVPLTVPRTNIVSLITAGQETEAEAAIDSLITNFSADPALPEALDNIAHRYEWTGRYEKAQSLYQQIAQQYPASSYAETAQLEMSKVDILQLVESGEDSEAETAIGSLITDFNDYRNLAEAVSRVAEQYQTKALRMEAEGSATFQEIDACLSKAIAIWERVIDELQDPVVVPQACCYAADCYHKLGEYEKSIACYKKVADDYPGYSMAWHALFMVGRNYEDLERYELMSKSETQPKIKAAYRQLIEKYPDCKVAKFARRWLSRHN